MLEEEATVDPPKGHNWMLTLKVPKHHRMKRTVGVAMHALNPSTWNVGAEGTGVHGELQLYSELSYVWGM